MTLLKRNERNLLEVMSLIPVYLLNVIQRNYKKSDIFSKKVLPSNKTCMIMKLFSQGKIKPILCRFLYSL